MDQARFLEHVRTHLGPADEASLQHAVGATLAAIGAMVGHTHRQAVAQALPEVWSRPFRDAHYDASLGREDLIRQVARSEHVPEGRALEHATAVLAALAATLEEDVRRVLEAELPEDVRGWVRPTRESRPPPRPPQRHEHHHAPHRLSDGQPGSRHPVSEAAPHDVHEGSVASSRDPHANTRLSSTRGTTQEREHETLAEGEPGSERPVSEGGD